jgi:outer membrane PBP1 activator LpoA protein
MRKLSRAIVVIISVVCLILSLSIFNGCTKHPNEQQLQALEEQRKAALAAEEQLAKCQQSKGDVERELAEKKLKLDDAKSEKEAVTSRLGEM